MTTAKRTITSPTSGPALPAGTNHVVSEAAAAPPGPDEPAGGDWLAERRVAPRQPATGVPVSTRSRGDKRRGQAVEAKRGQR